MKRLLLSVFLVACAPTPEPLHPAGPAVCEDGPKSPAARVVRDVAVTGPAVQTLRRAGDDILVVESGENTISRLDTRTGVFEQLVDVGDERGPWDVWVDDDEVWITNQIANTVTVANRKTGEIRAEIIHELFDRPAGITGLNDRVYVSNTQFRGTGDYGPGAVVIIDRESREVWGAVTTKRQNPQALATIDDAVVVVDSGVFLHDGERFVAGSEAAVEVWRPTSDPLLPETSIAVLPLVEDRAIGIPGAPAHHPDSSIIYLPSATAPVVFAYDLEAQEWTRGSQNPIELYRSEQNALHHAAIGAGGLLYVTAFNEDALYVVDTSCHEVLDVIALERSNSLAGPHGVAAIGDDVYFALEFAHELGRVELDFGEDDD